MITITEQIVGLATGGNLTNDRLWPVSADFSPCGYGGDWSKTPLGEILDGNKMNESGFTAKCKKFNCSCSMDHS